jgi:hypothetical protein
MPAEEKLEFKKKLDEHKDSRDALHDLFNEADPLHLKDEEFLVAMRQHEEKTRQLSQALHKVAKTLDEKKARDLKRIITNFEDLSGRQLDLCDRLIKGQLLNKKGSDKIGQGETFAPHKRALWEGKPADYFSTRFKTGNEEPLAAVEQEILTFLAKLDTEKSTTEPADLAYSLAHDVDRVKKTGKTDFALGMLKGKNKKR